MKNKRIIASILVGLSLCMTACATNKGGEKINSKQTQLYVITNDGGFSDNWLIDISESFEEKYANVSFQDGKVGVQIITEKTPDANATQMMNSFNKSIANVCFAEAINFNTGARSGMFKDISDVVNNTFDSTVTDVDGNQIKIEDEGIILDKLYDEQVTALTAVNNKYYALPFACSWGGFTYNTDIFDEKKLYFADDKEDAVYMDETNSSYTGKTYNGRGFVPNIKAKKSVGPDGFYNTFDDGLPSSYEELMYLLDFMCKKNVDPIVLTGGRYANYLISSLYCALEGADNMHAIFDSKSKDGQTMAVVTGFNGNTPIIERVAIDENNGYMAMQSAAKYYVYDLVNKILSNKNYFSHYTGTSFTDVQSYYINSNLRSGEKPIAFIVDGNYWMNEAREVINKAENNFPDKKIGSKLKSMPMPRQTTGTVDEGQGKPNALTNAVSIHTVINSNIEDENIIKLAKLFVRYVYTEDMMKVFTKDTNIPLMLKYQFTDSEYNELKDYGKNLWDMYKESMNNNTFVYPHSNNSIYLKQEDFFQMSNASRFWLSDTYGIAYGAFSRDKISTKDYFLDMKITKDKWDSDFRG